MYVFRAQLPVALLCVLVACAFLSILFFDAQNPNDPSTFPGQGVPQTPATPQGPVPSLNGTGNSLATMQTSQPQGYHGLPTV
jgi:hypothetical protein